MSAASPHPVACPPARAPWLAAVVACLLVAGGCKRSTSASSKSSTSSAASLAAPAPSAVTPTRAPAVPAPAPTAEQPPADDKPPAATATGSARTPLQARADAGGPLRAASARLARWRPDASGRVTLVGEGADAPVERWFVTPGGDALVREVAAWGLRWRLSAEGCRLEPLRWHEGASPAAQGLPCTRRDVRVLTALGALVLLADLQGAARRAALRLDRVRTSDDAPLELWLSSAALGARWRATVSRDAGRLEGLEGHGLMATDRAEAPLQHVSMEARVDASAEPGPVVHARDHDGEFGGWRPAVAARDKPRPRALREVRAADGTDEAAATVGARLATLTERAKAFDIALQSPSAWAAWPRELTLERSAAAQRWLPVALRAPQIGAALASAPGSREALPPPAPARRLAQLEPRALPAFIGTLPTDGEACLTFQLVGYEDKARPEEGEGPTKDDAGRRLRLIVRGCAGP